MCITTVEKFKFPTNSFMNVGNPQLHHQISDTGDITHCSNFSLYAHVENNEDNENPVNAE